MNRLTSTIRGTLGIVTRDFIDVSVGTRLGPMLLLVFFSL